jgi:hypothetical protein
MKELLCLSSIKFVNLIRFYLFSFSRLRKDTIKEFNPSVEVGLPSIIMTLFFQSKSGKVLMLSQFVILIILLAFYPISHSQLESGFDCLSLVCSTFLLLFTL